MKKICIVVSTSMTVKAFLIKHIEKLSEKFNVTVVTNSDIDLKLEYNINCKTQKIGIDRKINLMSDIKNILSLYSFFKKEKFDLVLSVTPKAGLLTSIASFLCRTKIRLHFFTGQVWVTKKGLFRALLKNIDKLIATLNTNSLIDSPSQRNFLISENVVKQNKSKVLLSGSISGVDVDKFKANIDKKNELKVKYSLNNEIVFMFIGRLNIDKGVLDLVSVFEKLFLNHDNIKLFLIGPDEENIEEKISDFLKNDNVIRIDYVSNPQEILNISDVLVLPSYREGFGTIVIESAAMGIPCIASDIYGLKDAVVDNKTGYLHEVKNLDSMYNKYEFIITNRDKINELGNNAKDRVMKEFKDDLLSIELLNFINGLLKK